MEAGPGGGRALPAAVLEQGSVYDGVVFQQTAYCRRMVMSGEKTLIRSAGRQLELITAWTYLFEIWGEVATTELDCTFVKQQVKRRKIHWRRLLYVAVTKICTQLHGNRNNNGVNFNQNIVFFKITATCVIYTVYKGSKPFLETMQGIQAG